MLHDAASLSFSSRHPLSDGQPSTESYLPVVGRRLPFPRLMAEPSPGLSMHEEMITEIAAGSTLARFRRVFGKTYPMSEKSRSLASLCNITTHRARSTIATQLGNAKDPMLLLELQQWLGHRWPASTLNYIRVTPTRLAKAYADAGYFGRNLRVVEVLIDQDAIKSGAAAAGQPWKLYDLGHGYCTYDFFDQCPHRMACAKCSFYRPKGSSQAMLLEGKANLLHMLQQIPLTDEERAAVDDGVSAFDGLLAKLADVPTPAGPTPRQLAGADGTEPREKEVLPVQ